MTPPGTPGKADGGAGDRAGDVVLEYLRAQADALHRHDPLVRQDAPDAVHQMRVAARRMRSALQAFGRVVDRRQTRALTEELKWLAGELAEARDTEVMAERFALMVADLDDELKLGPIQAALDRVFARRQVDARERALAALDSDRYRALGEAIDELLTDPPFTSRAGRVAARELPRAVRRGYQRLTRRMREADALPAGAARDEALHEARKAAKRLRYATEAAEPVVGKPATRLRKRLKTVQDLLGEHQDIVVAQPVLRDLAGRIHQEGGNAFTLGVLYARQGTYAEHIERELPRAWDRLRKPSVTSWLNKKSS